LESPLARVLLPVCEAAADVAEIEVTGGVVAGLAVAMLGAPDEITEDTAASAACLTTTRAASTTAGLRNAIFPGTMLRLGGDLNELRAQGVHQAIVECASMGGAAS